MKLIGFSGFVRKMVIVKSAEKERSPVYLGSPNPLKPAWLSQFSIINWSI
jgi:hypothetical protein